MTKGPLYVARRLLLGGARLACLVTALLLCLPCPARAQTDVPSPADAARSLFDEGRKLMKAGEHAAACGKFSASLRLVDHVSARFQLASCHEAVGRTASAWRGLLAVAEQTEGLGQTDRAKLARERAARLKPQLVSLRIELLADTPSLRLSLDGEAFARDRVGVSEPIDPGDHTVHVEAPGYQGFRRTVSAREPGSVVTVRVPPLVALAASSSKPPPSEPAAAPAPPPAPGADTTTEPAAAGLSGRIAALSLGGVALIGGVVGAIFVAQSLDKKSEARADGRCDDDNRCDPVGLPLMEDAEGAAHVATGAFVVAGAAAAAGLTVWLLSAPGDDAASTDSATLRITPTLGGAALMMGGSW